MAHSKKSMMQTLNRMEDRNRTKKDLSSMFGFSDAWKKVAHRLDDRKSKLRWANALERPLIELDIEILSAEMDKEEPARLENLDKLFKACEYFGVPRIWIGARELVGADGVRGPGDSGQAIWRISEVLGGETDYRGGCGNSDQSQTNDTEYFLPDQYINRAWDVATRTEIDIEPFQSRMVVSDRFKANPPTASTWPRARY